jgi:hypothetical protein
VSFQTHGALREWSLRVLEQVALHQDVPLSGGGERPIVFVPSKAREVGGVYAYLSGGALGLAHNIPQGAQLDGTKTPLRGLPEGLNLLIGRPSDAAAYDERAGE